MDRQNFFLDGKSYEFVVDGKYYDVDGVGVIRISNSHGSCVWTVYRCDFFHKTFYILHDKNGVKRITEKEVEDVPDEVLKIAIYIIEQLNK